jgi:hypothetical protein
VLLRKSFDKKEGLLYLEILNGQVEVLHQLILVDSHVVFVGAVVEFLLVSHERPFLEGCFVELWEEGLIYKHVESLLATGTLTPAKSDLFWP